MLEILFSKTLSADVGGWGGVHLGPVCNLLFIYNPLYAEIFCKTFFSSSHCSELVSSPCYFPLINDDWHLSSIYTWMIDIWAVGEWRNGNYLFMLECLMLWEKIISMDKHVDLITMFNTAPKHWPPNKGKQGPRPSIRVFIWSLPSDCDSLFSLSIREIMYISYTK